NRENTFISYYSYGSMLGLALDLSLRENGLNLDHFMVLMWKKYGKTEISYTNENIHETLNTYAGKEFGNHFFNNYIYQSGMPDFKRLFKTVGIDLSTNSSKVDLGVYLRDGILVSNPKNHATAYNAHLQKGDKLIKIGNKTISKDTDIHALINTYKVNDQVNVVFERFGKTKTTTLSLQADPSYSLLFMETDKKPLKKKEKTHRENWLGEKK
ncbi:MAG: PDZ domain-containing protein, partial [Xanthomarina sp.]